MTRAALPILYLSIAGVVAGCASTGKTTGEPVATPQTSPATIDDTALTAIEGGNGASISLADNLERVKEVFPAPTGSEKTSEEAITLPGESRYGWETSNLVFDAFEKGGKLTTLSLLQKNLGPAERQTEIDRELERFDEPSENAEGRVTAAYVWRDGTQVRIVVEFFGKENRGILRVVGTATALTARGFPLGDLSALIEGFDRIALQ